MIKADQAKNILLIWTVLLTPACNQKSDISDEVATPVESLKGVISIQSEQAEKSSDIQNDSDAIVHQRQGTKQEKTQAISFDDIKFEMKQDDPFRRSMLTQKIVDYDGQKIKIRGYILPSFKQDGLTQFVLVRDNLECCFGPGAALYDCVMVEMQAGKSASYSVRPVTVEGDFKITEWKDFDGVIRAIYHLDGDAVY